MDFDESSVFETNWETVCLISRGEFGEEVHKVLTDLKVYCAAKTVKLPVNEQNVSKTKERIERAMYAMQQLCKLRHENIMRFYDIKHKETTVVVLMELVTDKTLGEFAGNEPMLEPTARILLKQVCDALRYLHSSSSDKHCVIHRQINASTIVVSPDGLKAKLIDFGLAIMLIDTKDIHLSILRGDTRYMAPEMFLTKDTEETLYSCASDIWAFGCVLYRMMSGTRPFDDCKNMLYIGRRILNQGVPTLPDNCSGAIKDFYAGCTIRDRNERKTAAQLMEHDFMNPNRPKTQKIDSAQVSGKEATECYNVTSKRGLCIVINVQACESKNDIFKETTEKDVEAIKNLFQPLNFRVECPENTKSVEIWRCLQSAVSTLDNCEFDSFVCFIMAHGFNGIIKSSDGDELELKDIITNFRACRCPSMKGKPKIFIFQPLEEKKLDGESSPDDFAFVLREEDFLVCYATSKKHPESTFVQLLCQVIEKDPTPDMGIETAINKVSERLSIPPVKRGSRFFSQIPETVSSLTKNFLLRPDTKKTLPSSPEQWSQQQLSELCDSSESLSKRFGPQNQTLLMIASIKGNGELVSALLKLDTQPSMVGMQDAQLRTALCWAALRGHLGVLKAFEKAFESDPDGLRNEVNRADSLKQTPIILASKNQRTHVLKLLVEMGADLNKQDVMNFTAVAYATIEGHEDTVQVLCELGADLKLSDFSNNSPLIWAARCGNIGILRMLKEHLSDSADLGHWRQEGERGLNAQEWAKLCGQYECAEFIQDAIKSLADQTSSSSTPVFEGSGNGNNDNSGGQSSGAAGGAQGGGSGGAGSQDQSQSGSGGSGGGPGGQSKRNEFATIEYPMRPNGRGIALIINIMDFPHDSCLSRRDGSMEEMREHGLYDCFRRLGFDVKQFVNVSSIFFENILSLDSNELDYTKMNAFLLCVMSHGEQGHIFASDGARVLLENVFWQFRSCPGLRDKPKIFIVQACRALESDRFSAKQAGQLNTRIHEDCLYVYSTFKRNISFRNVATGGYFTRALQQTIQTQFDQMTEDFLSALTKVISAVVRNTEHMQVPCQLSTLRCRLRFPPVGMAIKPSSHDRCRPPNSD